MWSCFLGHFQSNKAANLFNFMTRNVNCLFVYLGIALWYYVKLGLVNLILDKIINSIFVAWIRYSHESLQWLWELHEINA